MDIIITGANGRMGRILTETALAAGHSLAARISPSFSVDTSAGTYPALADFQGTADVLIDFSSHAATGELMDWCTAHAVPAVIAATAQTREDLALIASAAQSVPVFLSANMSIGVALLAELARKAAALFPQADIEIIERHHNQKLDVPSGTALMLARRLQEVRPASDLLVGRHENGKRGREIGIHSLRYGSEVGTHEIILSTGSETLTLKHEAENRVLFAQGALAAAAFLIGRTPGLYDMRDIVE